MPATSAVPGGEPSDAGCLGPGCVDRSATFASRVDERLVDADFGGEGGIRVSESSVRKAAVQGCGGPQERHNGWLPGSLRRPTATNRQNPSGRLQVEAFGCMCVLSAARQKTEVHD